MGTIMDIENVWRAKRERVQAQKEEQIMQDVPSGWTEGLTIQRLFGMSFVGKITDFEDLYIDN
jgi:hypothetical protein